MVEYVTDIDILRPVNRSKSNGILFFNIVNRGNKGGLQLFNAGVPGGAADNNNLANPGDGFLLRKRLHDGLVRVAGRRRARRRTHDHFRSSGAQSRRICDNRHREERVDYTGSDQHLEPGEWVVHGEFRPLPNGEHR